MGTNLNAQDIYDAVDDTEQSVRVLTQSAYLKLVANGNELTDLSIDQIEEASSGVVMAVESPVEGVVVLVLDK